MIKNDFNYKWSKLFAAKRFDTDGTIALTPIEQQELLDDCDKLVKKLNIDDVSNCLEFVPSTQEGLFCAVCNEHKEYHGK